MKLRRRAPHSRREPYRRASRGVRHAVEPATLARGCPARQVARRVAGVASPLSYYPLPVDNFVENLPSARRKGPL